MEWKPWYKPGRRRFRAHELITALCGRTSRCATAPNKATVMSTPDESYPITHTLQNHCTAENGRCWWKTWVLHRRYFFISTSWCHFCGAQAAHDASGCWSVETLFAESSARLLQLHRGCTWNQCCNQSVQWALSDDRTRFHQQFSLLPFDPPAAERAPQAEADAGAVTRGL